jgi:hypothetical protein
MKILDWLFPKRDLKKHFLDFTPLNSHWRVVAWNHDLTGESRRHWSVEVHSDKLEAIHFYRKSMDEVSFVTADKVQVLVPVDSKECVDLMNLALHSTLKYGLKANQEFMLIPVSGAIAQDLQTEARALQWVQATFGTVARALEKLQKEPELVLTAMVFSGVTPDTQERVLRVMIFNLDIFFYLRPDHSLQLVVFDDKNLGHGTSKTPMFQQIIKVTKPQFYDEIVRLVQQIASVGEIR